MGIILGFLPDVAFFLLQRRIGTSPALLAGALLALAIVIRSRIRPPHTVKILEVGTVAILLGLAAYTYWAGLGLSLLIVQLCVKAGVLLIALVSLAVARPFTLPYAREHVDEAYWNSARLIRANYVITGAWAAAFAAAVLADAVIMLDPAVPESIGFATAPCLLIAGIAFTIWYSKRAKSQADA